MQGVILKKIRTQLEKDKPGTSSGRRLEPKPEEAQIKEVMGTHTAHLCVSHRNSRVAF